MGNEQSQPDSSAIQPTTTGYHVLKIKPDSPAEYAGLQPFFDFILAINDLPLDAEDSTLTTTIKNSIDQKVKLTVWNGLREEFRVVELVPHWWGGPDDGLIGCSIRYCAYAGASQHIFHVLSVHESSPAHAASLTPAADYIVASPDTVYYEASDFYDDIQAHAEQGVGMRLLVYNKQRFDVREVDLRPRGGWGGEGLLGCELGYGALHRIEVVKGRDVKMQHGEGEDGAGAAAEERPRVDPMEKQRELNEQMKAMGISTGKPELPAVVQDPQQVSSTMSFDSIPLADTPAEDNPSLPRRMQGAQSMASQAPLPPQHQQQHQLQQPQAEMTTLPLTPQPSQPAQEEPKQRSGGGMFGFLSYIADTVAPPPPKEALMKRRQQAPEMSAPSGSGLSSIADRMPETAAGTPPTHAQTQQSALSMQQASVSVASASPEVGATHVTRVADPSSVVSNATPSQDTPISAISSLPAPPPLAQSHAPQHPPPSSLSQPYQSSGAQLPEPPREVSTPSIEDHSFSAQVQSTAGIAGPPFYGMHPPPAGTPSSYAASPVPDQGYEQRAGEAPAQVPVDAPPAAGYGAPPQQAATATPPVDYSVGGEQMQVSGLGIEGQGYAGGAVAQVQGQMAPSTVPIVPPAGYAAGVAGQVQVQSAPSSVPVVPAAVPMFTAAGVAQAAPSYVPAHPGGTYAQEPVPDVANAQAPDFATPPAVAEQAPVPAGPSQPMYPYTEYKPASPIVPPSQLGSLSNTPDPAAGLPSHPRAGSASPATSGMSRPPLPQVEKGVSGIPSVVNQQVPEMPVAETGPIFPEGAQVSSHVETVPPPADQEPIGYVPPPTRDVDSAFVATSQAADVSVLQTVPLQTGEPEIQSVGQVPMFNPMAADQRTGPLFLQSGLGGPPDMQAPVPDVDPVSGQYVTARLPQTAEPATEHGLPVHPGDSVQSVPSYDAAGTLPEPPAQEPPQSSFGVADPSATATQPYGIPAEPPTGTMAGEGSDISALSTLVAPPSDVTSRIPSQAPSQTEEVASATYTNPSQVTSETAQATDVSSAGYANAAQVASGQVPAYVPAPGTPSFQGYQASPVPHPQVPEEAPVAQNDMSPAPYANHDVGQQVEAVPSGGYVRSGQAFEAVPPPPTSSQPQIPLQTPVQAQPLSRTNPFAQGAFSQSSFGVPQAPAQSQPFAAPFAMAPGPFDSGATQSSSRAASVDSVQAFSQHQRPPSGSAAVDPVPTKPSPFSLGTPSAIAMAQPSPTSSPQQHPLPAAAAAKKQPMRFKEAPNPFAGAGGGLFDAGSQGEGTSFL